MFFIVYSWLKNWYYSLGPLWYRSYKLVKYFRLFNLFPTKFNLANTKIRICDTKTHFKYTDNSINSMHVRIRDSLFLLENLLLVSVPAGIVALPFACVAAKHVRCSTCMCARTTVNKNFKCISNVIHSLSFGTAVNTLADPSKANYGLARVSIIFKFNAYRNNGN